MQSFVAFFLGGWWRGCFGIFRVESWGDLVPVCSWRERKASLGLSGDGFSWTYGTLHSCSLAHSRATSPSTKQARHVLEWQSVGNEPW